MICPSTDDWSLATMYGTMAADVNPQFDHLTRGSSHECDGVRYLAYM
jgi:hypothetical protein